MDGRRIDRSQMLSGFSGAFSPSFERLMNKFFITLFVSLIGLVVGFVVFPTAPALFYGAVIIEFGLLISAAFFRRKIKVGYSFVYAYAFFSGATLFYAIGFYVQALGFAMVASAVAVTTFGFGALAFYGYTTKRDLTFMSGMLFIGVISLIGFSLVGIFVPGINVGFTGLLIAAAGVAIFSGYTILDMNMYARYMTTEEEMPMFVLSIYLDYINLLMYVLRLLYVIFGRRD